MRELVDELVDYSIDTDSPTDELELGIFWILEDEVVLVEVA